MRKKRPAEPGEGSADDENDDLQPVDIDADGIDRNLAVPDGANQRAELRVDESMLKNQGDDEEREDDEIEFVRVQEHATDLRLGHGRYAQIASCYRGPFLENLPNHPAEGDRHHCQIRT